MGRKKTTDDKPKSKGIFDHINEIRLGKRPDYFSRLTDADKKTWSSFMVCRFLSMDQSLVEMVQDLQQYYQLLTPERFYRVLSTYIPEGRSYNAYVKSKTEKMDASLVKILSLYFQDSEKNVEEYAHLLSVDDIRNIVKKYGYTDKQIDTMIK
jgi:hypothetical protein